MYQFWTKKTMVFWQLSWSSFEYKKLVRELSKKVHKFSETEKFVFIFEQSAQLFREIFYKISPKVIRVDSRYLWSIYTNITSFCWYNFHGRNFDARRNFDYKPTIEGFKKRWKMTIESKKSDFLAISRVVRVISWKRVKRIHRHIF